MRLRCAHLAVLPVVLLLLSSSASADRRTITIAAPSQAPAAARAIDSMGVVYLAVNDFITALGLPFGESVETRKIEFRLASHRLKVTANNPYLVITDLATGSASVYQLQTASVFESGVYYVPIQEFIRVLSFIWTTGLAFDAPTMALTVSSSPVRPAFDITDLTVEPKLNGYLLTLKASRRLGDVEAWLKPDGWLFVTVTDAKADTNALSKLRPTNPIKKILVFQSPSSVQLTFRLSPDVVKAEIVDDPTSADLQLSLRTQTAVERAELENSRQATVRQNLERDRDRWKMDVVVIDAGHGGMDPGTIGVRGTREKDVTLQIALKLGKLIEERLPDVRVVYTRKDDTFVELYKRAQIANEAEEREWTIFSVCLAVFLSAAFGANAVAIKISVSGIGPFTAAGIRFFIASLVIFAWARATGRSFHVYRNQVYPLFVLFLLFISQISFLYLGISRTNASRAVLISNLQPFFVLFLAHFFIPDDRITFHKVIGLLLGFTGVCLVFLEKEGVTEGFQIGDLLMILMTALWAASTVFTKTVLDRLSPHFIAFYQMILSVPFFFLAGLLWDQPMIGTLNGEVVVAVLYQALVAAAFGFIAWNTLLQHHGAVILNSFNFIMPVAGVFLAWWLLQEPLTVKILLALFFIIAQMVVLYFEPKRRFLQFPFNKGL